MATLSSLLRQATWIAGATLAASVLSLVHCISAVVRTERQARLLGVPLVPRQEVDLPEAGRVVLALEGPILSRRLAGLEFELVGPGGSADRGRPLLFRARTTGFSRAKVDLRMFDVAVPGRHGLRIHGLGEARPGDEDHRVVLERPHLAATMGYVLCIVLSAGVAVASLVLLLQRLLGIRAA
jgi:hypothetical protein